MSQVITPVEPGWRPDPSGRFEWRYWDGGWTNRVANSTAAPAPVPAPGPVLTPAPAPEAIALTEALPAPVDASINAPVAGTALTQRDVAPRVEPFGPEVPVHPVVVEPVAPTRTRRSPWGWFVAFVRSFADQPESYHSPHTPAVLPPDPRGENIIAAPGNYGHAALVALAACGIAGGAYLPWLAGTIDAIPFHQSGFDLGNGLGYSLGAAALALSALLAVRLRVLRWMTMVLALVLCGFIARDLVKTYDTMQTMNTAVRIQANVAMGLWIMVISVAIAMIASVRLSEDQKMV
jgi:hypothetical protein